MNVAIPIDAVAEVGAVEIETVTVVLNDAPDGGHAQRERVERLRFQRDGTGEDGSAEGVGHVIEARATAGGAWILSDNGGRVIPLAASHAPAKKSDPP